jgi:DnaA-homolog protein
MNMQLPLAIQLNDEATFADFCWGDNALLHQQIELSLAGNGERLMHLWGSSGCGKSHLLQACCQAVTTMQSAIYLPLKQLLEWGPQILEGLDEQHWISIDDLDVVAGDVAWEEALFHLYNRIRDNGKTSLLISSQLPPASIPIRLPDLQSRLSWGLVIHLCELKDKDKISTLIRHAKNRGLELPLSVGRFLINRCGRNMHDLDLLLNRLDKASLIAQRKITIPFVKSVLGI